MACSLVGLIFTPPLLPLSLILSITSHPVLFLSPDSSPSSPSSPSLCRICSFNILISALLVVCVNDMWISYFYF